MLKIAQWSSARARPTLSTPEFVSSKIKTITITLNICINFTESPLNVVS